MAVEPLLVHPSDARQTIDTIRHLAEPQGNLTEKLLMQLKLACDLIKLLSKPPLAIALDPARSSKLFLRATSRSSMFCILALF